MKVGRGDIVLVYLPFSDGQGGKRRPALVVQSDRNNGRLKSVIVASITTTLHRSHEPTQVLIDVTTTLGRQSGLLYNSAITCESLATIAGELIERSIGSLPEQAMADVDRALKASLGL